MSVYVTIRVTVDPAVFEEQAAAHAEAIGRIMEVAKGKGPSPTAGSTATGRSWPSTSGQTPRASRRSSMQLSPTSARSWRRPG